MWGEEMQVLGGGPTLGYGGSQWDTMGYRGSRWDMGVPMGYRGSHLDVGCPGLHDRLDGGDAGGGGRPHFGIWGVLMRFEGSQWEMGGPDGIRWDTGGPNGIQGVPFGCGVSRST